MSLRGFQQALTDLIAAPDLCRAARVDPGLVLDRYDLAPRERVRLMEIIRQPGMSVNCSLYRANRITPLYTALPFTCFLLGADLKQAVDRFWNEQAEVDLQFKFEIVRFAEFLQEQSWRTEAGDLLLKEVLDFELAVHGLRFLPRRRIIEEMNRAGKLDRPSLRLHPLVRLVEFRHDPSKLLTLLAETHPLPYDLAEGEFYVLLDAREETFQMKKIDSQLGRVLQAIKMDQAEGVGAGDVELLLTSGLAVI
jgi:hypothetical protein